MDYKEKYLRLKQQTSNQRGSGRMNPLFVKQLSDLAFVVGDNVLRDDVRSVIMSLVEQFNRIAVNDLKNNVELSQYYGAGNGLMTRDGKTQCENCELVLRYEDATVCMSNGRLQGDKPDVECSVSRGLVRFYIKQKDGNTYKYTPIQVVKVDVTNSLQPYTDLLYQNNDEAKKLEEASTIAISRGQSGAIVAAAQKNGLSANNSEGITTSIKNVNRITSEAKNAATTSQLNLMTRERMVSAVPTQSSVNVANTVAQNIMRTRTATENNMTVVMVPDRGPIPMQGGADTDAVPATVSSNGTTITSSSKRNTLNSRAVNNRASIAVDANVAVVPVPDVAKSKNVAITTASPKSTTSLYNNLVAAISAILEKAEDIVKSAGRKVDDIGRSAGRQVEDIGRSTTRQIEDITNPATSKTQEIGKTISRKSEDISQSASRKMEDIKRSTGRQTQDISKSATGQSKEAATAVKAKTQDMSKKIDEIADKVKDFFGDKPSSTQASVVPVSKDLTVMTPLPVDQALAQVPVPRNETITQAGGASKQFEDRLANKVSLDNTTTASATVRNGTASRKKQESMNSSSSIDQATASSNRSSQQTTNLPQQGTETSTSYRDRSNTLTDDFDLTDAASQQQPKNRNRSRMY